MTHSTVEKLFDGGVGIASVCYGLWYGAVAYFAPDMFGPKGAFPIYKKTDFGDNELDPITSFYIRMHGLQVLAIVLTFYFFTRGSKERKRAYTKMLLCKHLCAVLTCFRVMQDKDFDEFYHTRTWQLFLVLGILHIVWLVSVLKRYPAVRITNLEAVLTTNERVSLVLVAIYGGFFCIHNLLIGPVANYVDTSKLEDGKFNLIMRESCHMMGTAIAPYVLFILTDAWKMPSFAWKILCLYTILFTQFEYLAMNDTSGYAVKKPFVGDYVGLTFCMFLGFWHLGSFKKVKTVMKVKASKAA